MPLLDHFRPPIHPVHRWESFHSNWATRIADSLNERLSSDFLAEEHIHAGPHLEIDVATFLDRSKQPNGGSGTTALALETWSPPQATFTIPASFPDCFEVRVYSNIGGRTLVGVVELISPGNKDRPESRDSFAQKCASYLHEGISVVIIDIVTERRGNLHHDILKLLHGSETARLGDDATLYAVAYRPVIRDERSEIDCWPEPLSIGKPLPTMPLRLTGDLFVPVELESTYAEACRRRKIG